MVCEINPENATLGQIRNHWQNIATILIWKLARDGVRITEQDLDKFQAEVDAGDAVLFTHGHKDSIEFSIVTEAAAKELAAFDVEKAAAARIDGFAKWEKVCAGGSVFAWKVGCCPCQVAIKILESWSEWEIRDPA